MRTKVLLTLAVIAMLLVGTAAIASNMGFKISIPLNAYAAGTHTGFNWVALPYFVSYADATAAWTDISSIAGIGTVTLQQFQENNGTYLIYDGDMMTDNFTITSGGQLVDAKAILVQVGATRNWVVVGSHSPSMTVPIYAYAAGTHTGFNWVSIPYHRTAADATALWTQLAAVTPNTATVTLQQFQESNGTYLIYDGDMMTDNFTVTAGLPVLIQSSANKTWTPAHY